VGASGSWLGEPVVVYIDLETEGMLIEGTRGFSGVTGREW